MVGRFSPYDDHQQPKDPGRFGNESSSHEVLVFTRRPDGGLEVQEIGADVDRTFDKFGEVGNGEEEEEDDWKMRARKAPNYRRNAAAHFRVVPSSQPKVPLSLLALLLLSFIIVPLTPNTAAKATDYAGHVRHCSPADLTFQYTPCDQNSVTCPAGHFLEMHAQQCQQCQPGTFSLGDRLRYEQFDGDKLPEGFSVQNSPDESFSNLYSAYGGGLCPLGGGWAMEEGELRYRWTHCESTLSIALHLVRPGFAEFRYRISRDSRGLLPLLRVRNAQCQSYGANNDDRHSSTLRDGSKLKQKQQQQQQQQQQSAESSAAEGDIRVQRLALRAGQNLITWSVSSNPVLSTRMEMVRLLRLDLSGLAFTPECSACPAGTFANQLGAEQCEPCPQDSFSMAGARRCTPCATHQWAEPRSKLCQLRPKCQPIDFYSVRPQQCNGTRRVYQRKIEPTVCLDEPGAYTALSELEECPPCPFGMYRNPRDGGECQKCPEGEVSDDGKVCVPCPSDAQPEHGLFINRWDAFPPGITPKFECEFVFADELAGDCRVTPAWISHGDRMESVQTRFKGVALEMSIHISDGFYAPLHSGRVSADNPLALISVELELFCKDDSCQFYIVQEIDPPVSVLLPLSESGAQRGELQMLALLNGTHARRVLQVSLQQ
uniref:Ephrin_rec_like domain-containing protein n=1 Tax=Globodera pallida TaxID=36090 RepID=A0A183BT82_GLOPA